MRSGGRRQRRPASVAAGERGRPVEDHLAGAQSDDALRELARQHHVVDVDDGGKITLLADLADQPHDLARGLGIEARRRLVDEEQFGILLERPGDTDTLALASGEGIGALVDMFAEPDPVEQRERLVDVGLREAPGEGTPERHVSEAAGEHVLHHRQPLHQRVFLEDHADAPAGAAKPRARQAGDLRVLEEDAPAGRLDQAIDAADEGRFSGPRRSDQSHHLSGRNLERDAAKGAVAGAILLLETFDA